MNCPRCEEDKPLLYRVKSDLIDEVVCAECAVQAMALDLWVGEVNEDEAKAKRHKDDL